MARRQTGWLGWRAMLLGAACCIAACRTSKARAPEPAGPAPGHFAPGAQTAVPPVLEAPAGGDASAGDGADATPEAADAGPAAVDARAGDGSAGDAGAEAAPAREPHPKTRIEIDLERTPCFGTCPIYTLKLYGDGTVVFDGKDHVARGLHVVHIPAGQVRDLARWLERAGFFALSWNKHCGKGQATDHPSAITTLRIGRHKRTINHYHGDPCAPGVLDTWEQRIDKVAGTSRWPPP